MENEIINKTTKVCIKCEKFIRLHKIDVNSKTVKAPISDIPNTNAATGNPAPVIRYSHLASRSSVTKPNLAKFQVKLMELAIILRITNAI